MQNRLLQRSLPATGIFTGPPSHPDRYRLLSELSPPDNETLGGRAAASCVWKAEDTVSAKVIALKIHRAYHPTWRKEAEALWRAAGYARPQLDEASKLASSHPGQERCVEVLHSFQLPKEDGSYYIEADGVVITSLLGPTLVEWQEARPSLSFPLPTVRIIVRQVLLALDYLHTGLKDGETDEGIVVVDGLAHMAICRENILLSKHYTSDELRKDKPLSSPSIKLVGFSHSTIERDQIATYGALSYNSAELNLDSDFYKPPSRADVWAVGTLISNLIFDRDLSLYDADARYYSPVVVYASMYPDEPWPKSLSYGYFCSLEPFAIGERNGIKRSLSLRERMEKEGKVSDLDEFEGLYEFLKACWTLDAEKRPSAKELLAHEWLREAA